MVLATTDPSIPDDGDEETLKLLTSGSSNIDLTDRLKGVFERLQEDFSHEEGNGYWKSLTSQLLSDNGFPYSATELSRVAAAAVGSSSSKFSDPDIQAVAAFLKLPKSRAIQVLEASSVLAKDEKKDILQKATVCHFQQQWTRLLILTECLRVEQDPDAAQQSAVKHVLDSIDSLFVDQGNKKRGLFRRLVSLACMPDRSTTREHLEPAKTLLGKDGASFAAFFLEEVRSQTKRERTQALEALSVLLYHRIDQGICRRDLALLLKAFFLCDFFVTSSHKNNQRLTKLAGLICAESMGLWRAFEQWKADEVWATRHPLLLGIINVETQAQTKAELESLKAILMGCVQTISKRPKYMMNEVPEALALLSFGLLLCLAHESLKMYTPAQLSPEAYWYTFRTAGAEIVSIANDQAGAFDYLYALVKFLSSKGATSPNMKKCADHGQFYDWQLSNFNKKDPLLIASEAETDTTTSADVIAYTSIAREVVAAAISAFGETILAIEHPNACDNIGLLCKLASIIYQSNPLLSEEFWVNWQSFISTNSESGDSANRLLPVCCLMEAAHNLANAALEALENNYQHVSEEMFLPAVAPFFLLLSSLCHSPKIVETTIGILLPGNMLRKALLSCRLPTAVTGPESYTKCRIMVLEAVSKLSQAGSSTSSSLDILRLSLEIYQKDEHGQPDLVDGPRVLGRILSSTKETSISNPVLEIMASLLTGAPLQWALELARQCITNSSLSSQQNGGQQQQQSILNSFLAPGMDNSVQHAAALVLAELIEHLTDVVFCKSFSETDAVAFLHVVAEGVSSAATALTPSVIKMTGDALSPSVTFETAQIILQLFSNFLKLIRTVIELHQSPQVSTAAVQVRDSLIGFLATSVGLGQAIAYYASAPVSLSLSIKLSTALANDNAFQGDESSSGSKNNNKNFGLWQILLSKESGPSSSEHLGKKLLWDSVASIGVADFDLEGMQQRGWTGNFDDTLAPLKAAWSAIQLLSMWALHVEDIAKTYVEDALSPPSFLDGQAKELINRLSPQKLLASAAPSPIPCRSNSSLATVWETTGLSNFEMLLPYLSSSGDDVSSSFAAAIPSSLTLDLLHSCLIHARYTCPAAEIVGDTMLFRVVYRSSIFSTLLIDSVEKGVSLSTKERLTFREKTDVTNGLLSLRLLCTCVESSPAVADKMLQLESNDPFVPTLIKVASKALNLLDIGNKSSNEIFKSEGSIIQMRQAAGAVSVLSSLWTSARTTSPGQSKSVGSRVVKIVEDQTAFISDLMTIVMGYANANDIESKIVPSIESEYTRCTLATFMSKSLDILATEVAYGVCNGGTNTNVTLENLLLKAFFQPQRFTSFNGYKFAAESTMKFTSMKLKVVGNLKQPISLLRCFPSTSSNHLSQDFYTRENSFDVGSSARWLGNCSAKNEDIEDIMARVSISYQLASCDLKMIASWKGFAEVLVYFSVEHAKRSGNETSSPSAARLLNLAQETLRALHFNIKTINEAQVKVAEDFMRGKSSRMATLLTNLFLFFLEKSSENEESAKLLDCDELLDLLDLLTKTSEMLFTVISSLPANVTTTKDLETCCTLERPLLASAILINSLIESKSSSLSDPQKSREKGIYNSLCRVGSKVLKVLGEVIKESNRKQNNCEMVKRKNRESLCCCISLFTVLVTKGNGPQISDASYFKLISETLKEHDVLKQLIGHGLAASTTAATSISSPDVGPHSQQYWKRGPTKEEKSNLIVVQSILNLLYSIAGANNPEMLSILLGTQLSQLIARNPLYKYAKYMWTQFGDSTMPPRGYIVSDERAGLAMQNGPMAAVSFHIGKNDPIHAIWLTSMKILQASLRSSTNCLNIQGTESIGKLFFGMSAEFLEINREALISCLKYCGSKLTRNALLESTHILALVAELCKRDTRDVFVHRYGRVCEELVDWSKFGVVSISKFLGAAGTARELFGGLEESESLDSDFDFGNASALPAKSRHPLLSKGRLQDAKHEAYKFSDFAARCCQRVTKLDFEAATTVPAHLQHLSLDRNNDELLERNCRLSVTSDFNLQMERAASDCLSQAISTIWKTHPCSRSFKMFSEREALQLDAMGLVQPGVVIGFRPADGDGILADGTSETFGSLRFGRVLSDDTVNRTWEVNVLKRSGGDTVDSDTKEVVRVRQLAGIEDISMRKAVALYMPAPDTENALKKGCPSFSLGHLILVLRWCHQRCLSLRESNLPDGLKKIKSTARMAEQAVALLGAELAIHAEISSALNMDKTTTSQLDSQIYELFADYQILSPLMDDGTTTAQIREGRLKDVIGQSAWDAIRPQVRSEVERGWKLIKEKEQSRQKRAYGESNWFSGSLRSKGYKSAFRG